MTDGTMRAAVVAGPKAFRVDEVPRPEPGSGEVRVRVESCGVCGSDLTFYHQNLMRVGQTPGHEIAGVVDAVGPGVSGLDEGKRGALVSKYALQARTMKVSGSIVSAPRVGLYRPWSPSIEEGWPRRVLEMYEFDFLCLRYADV